MSRRGKSIALFACGAWLLWAAPSTAQSNITTTPPQAPGSSTAATQPADPNSGAFTLTGNVDFLNQYMFRGIRQNSTGLVTWPTADLAVAAYNGNGGLKSVGINLGTWNSLHTGDTGVEGPSGKLWYESDFYTTVTLGLSGGIALATTYTAYTSPNSGFSNVKEVMVKLTWDDSPHFGKCAVKPYAIIAREFDTASGVGQADNGAHAGTYLEIGFAPGYAGAKASIAVPVKVGLSLSNYYELSGIDHTFGFFSIAGIVTVPLGSMTNFGAWNIHGGGEFQKLGDTTTSFNGGKSTQVIGSLGIGFTY
jgi:hypothetical protein